MIDMAKAATTFTKRVANSQIISEGEVSPGEYDAYIAYLKGLRDDYAMQKQYCDTHRHHSFFNIFRITARCPTPLQLYPLSENDGSKFGCALDKLETPCVIYSFGSGNNIDWETAMLPFGCEVHIFDCYAPEVKGLMNITYHKFCVDGHDHDNHYTIPSLMKKLGHKKIDFLKMDVEGAEYQSLPTLGELSFDQLPSQIAVEIHQWPQLEKDGRTPQKLLQTLDLMLSLHQLGYRLMSRFDNFPYGCCSEFLYGIPEKFPGVKSSRAVTSSTGASRRRRTISQMGTMSSPSQTSRRRVSGRMASGGSSHRRVSRQVSRPVSQIAQQQQQPINSVSNPNTIGSTAKPSTKGLAVTSLKAATPKSLIHHQKEKAQNHLEPSMDFTSPAPIQSLFTTPRVLFSNLPNEATKPANFKE